MCAATCIAMVLLSFLPQIHLWLARGHDWNGAYLSPQGDEPLYSAYINALINGRTRKNDPFGGRDNSASKPLPESIFSIQFVPAYAVALPARALGLSASTAFIILIGVAALFASAAIFLLLNSVGGDPRLAASGTLFVLCLGCVVGRHGVFATFLDIYPAAFPFLRRYQPAVSFPLFFIFQFLVWRALVVEQKRTSQIFATLASLTLALLIFSHLYLWTASAAWLVCIGALWFWFRPSDRWKTSMTLITVGALTIVALVPYIYLLSHRAATLDQQLIMVSTHRADLWRIHELLCAVILGALVIGILRRRIERKEPRIIYVASLALLSFVVFNQQILTGRTMQSFHFETFVVNYTTLVGLVILLTLYWKSVPRRFLIWMAAFSVAFGIMVVALPSRLLFVPQAIAKDRIVPVLLRLNVLSKHDGTLSDLSSKGEASTIVFSPSVAVITLLPTWTSQGTLLDLTGVDCLGLTRQERKRMFHLHLYYSGTDIESFRRALNGTSDVFPVELAGVRTAIFGYERTSPALTPEFRPIEQHEIESEVQAYQTYVNSFSRGEALSRPLHYAVIPAGGSFNFSNIDRWYERDAGERFGEYTLYRLSFRN